MAIISFWSNSKNETGKSASMAAIATLLGINHNYKILILDTKYNDDFYENCYWQEDKTQKLINGNIMAINIESGINGLAKAILSNKTSPEIITNYTRIVFTNNRLEVLTDTKIQPDEYETHKKLFKDIAKIANRYYDLVFIDIDDELDENTKDSLLQVSDIIVVNMPQKLKEINGYLKTREENLIFKEKEIIPLLSRYDSYSKYNVKNVARYIKEKRGVCSVPYNTLFFEACSEGKVADLFIKLRKVSPKDRNAVFINSVQETIEHIITRLKELQMKM